MAKNPVYSTHIQWTGNLGKGTSSYESYDRSWDIAIEGKPTVHCSNDPLFLGDPTKMNPEDLLLSSLSACHMLWFLHYASEAGIVVISYTDTPQATGEISHKGAGRFLSAELKPHIVVKKDANIDEANNIHQRIPEVCFIERSLNFPVTCNATHVFESD